MAKATILTRDYSTHHDLRREHEVREPRSQRLRYLHVCTYWTVSTHSTANVMFAVLHTVPVEPDTCLTRPHAFFFFLKPTRSKQMHVNDARLQKYDQCVGRKRCTVCTKIIIKKTENLTSHENDKHQYNHPHCYFLFKKIKHPLFFQVFFLASCI